MVLRNGRWYRHHPDRPGIAFDHLLEKFDATHAGHHLIGNHERNLFPVEEAVRKLTSEPAELFGLRDRGAVREGAFADLNVIDFDALRVLEPEYIQDFPAGAWRYIQRGEGYRHTLVNGRAFMENGQHTGEHSGALLRS